MALRSVLALVQQAARERPRQTFVEAGSDDRVVRYAELAEASRRWRTVATAPGNRPVLLACADPVRFAVAYVGLLTAGRLVAPVSREDVGPRLSYDSRSPALVVTDDRRLDTGDLPRILVDTRGCPGGTTEGALLQPSAPGRVLLASSGTTGPRKGIELSEDALLAAARSVASALALEPHDRGYNPLPLIHVNAEVVGVLATLTVGSSLVLDARFSRMRFWERMAALRITWINAVPAILTILSAPDAPAAVNRDPSASTRIRLVRSASSPLPVPVLHRFQQQHGIPVIETYGMTEAASQIASNPVDGSRKAGSVGRPVGVDLRVVDETRGLAPTGQVGRVQIRGRSVVAGYVGGAGSDRFDSDGWLDTGDLGRLDEDGYLFLCGRDSDVINRGGEKIFPVDVERVLLTDPAVRAAAVTGWPDPVLGEVPVAFVVPVPGQPESAYAALLDRLRARCATSLPRRSCPADLVVVPDLPLGPTGKVLRRALIEPAPLPG